MPSIHCIVYIINHILINILTFYFISRYTGVLETIRIRQHGFSHRIPFGEFLKRYSFLAIGFEERVAPGRDACRLVLVRLHMDGWALGKNKVNQKLNSLRTHKFRMN